MYECFHVSIPIYCFYVRPAPLSYHIETIPNRNSPAHEAFVVQRSVPHGHVAAVLGLCRQLGLPRLLHRTAGRMRELALAGLVARVLSPASKLATARQLSPDTAAFSLGAVTATSC